MEGNALCIRGSLNEDQDLWSDSFGRDLYHQEPGSSTKGTNGNQMMMKPTFSIPGKLKCLSFDISKPRRRVEVGFKLDEGEWRGAQTGTQVDRWEQKRGAAYFLSQSPFLGCLAFYPPAGPDSPPPLTLVLRCTQLSGRKLPLSYLLLSQDVRD